MALKDEYFTISEAAKDIGVTRQTISRWIAEHNIPVEKIGRVKLIKKKDLKYQNMRLSFTAARQIDALIYRIFSDYCQEKGYINATEHITAIDAGVGCVEFTAQGIDGTSRIVKVSLEERKRMSEIIVPKVAAYLEDYYAILKEKANQLIGDVVSTEIEGGKTKKK